MQWSEEAYILSIKKHGESSAILSVLTSSYGLAKGYCRGAYSKRNQGIYMPGNFVSATWNSRLPEYLGNFNCELLRPITATFMTDPLRLSALTSICSLIEKTLSEKEPQPILYDLIDELFNRISANDNWQAYYIKTETELLSILGFGLDLTSCAATGDVDNLIYLSPKSGRAVSRDAGEPYKDKLFLLPNFLKNDTYENINSKDINNGLAICSYFLNKYIFKEHEINHPQERLRFVGLMKEEIA